MRTRMAAGFLAAAFPDADFLVYVFGTLNYLNYHRGLTHSVVMLPLWALFLSLVCMLLWRNRYPWRYFYGVSLMGLGIHIAGDVITAYGTMIFTPLSEVRVAWPTTFILDGYFTGILLVTLLAVWLVKARAQLMAVSGLLLLAGYVGFQAYLHQQANSIGLAYINAQGLTTAQSHALPQPLSPFNWKIIVKEQQAYHIAYVNLLREKPIKVAEGETGLFARVEALYLPVAKAEWVTHPRYGASIDWQILAKSVWDEAALKDIRQFMLYPALRDVDQRNIGLCAWFHDHRFVLDGIRTPFKFGACRRDNRSRWLLYRLQENRAIPLF